VSVSVPEETVVTIGSPTEEEIEIPPAELKLPVLPIREGASEVIWANDQEATANCNKKKEKNILFFFIIYTDQKPTGNFSPQVKK
jgi:hypothetical protein